MTPVDPSLVGRRKGGGGGGKSLLSLKTAAKEARLTRAGSITGMKSVLVHMAT